MNFVALFLAVALSGSPDESILFHHVLKRPVALCWWWWEKLGAQPLLETVPHALRKWTRDQHV
jgi:hypothetical protein